MNDPRGSIWRKWDLHVHTPGTKKNDQYTNQKSYDEALDFYCDKIEQSNVAVFGITDYFSADSYFAFIEKFRKKHPDSSNADFAGSRKSPRSSSQPGLLRSILINHTPTSSARSTPLARSRPRCPKKATASLW
jgi:hypothetical protein